MPSGVMHVLYCESKGILKTKTINSSLGSLTRTLTEHMDMVPRCLLTAVCYLWRMTVWMGKKIKILPTGFIKNCHVAKVNEESVNL